MRWNKFRPEYLVFWAEFKREETMKQLIVLACVLPILLLFLAQYALDQRNSAAISLFQEQVYTAKEQARQEGCFTPEIKGQLRERIGSKLGIDPVSVVIEATEIRQYRVNYYDSKAGRGLIHYKICIPIEKFVAGGTLLGIRPEENRGFYTIEGTTASEKLPD